MNGEIRKKKKYKSYKSGRPLKVGKIKK